MYLLTMASADVQAGTYHGSWGLKTIATITPVRIAPLGNSQAFRFLRRIGASIRAATATALARPGATCAMPSPIAAMTVRTAKTMVRRPFGVRKNRRTETGKTLRRIALQSRGHNQPIHALTLEQLNAVGGAKHERGRGKRVGRHRGGCDDGHARDRIRGCPCAWIENVMAIGLAIALLRS